MSSLNNLSFIIVNKILVNEKELIMTKEKNDLFRKTEYELYNYKFIESKIKSIDIDIDILKNDISLKGISYEEKTGPTNAFNSSVENEIIRRAEEVQIDIDRLTEKRRKLIGKKKRIELGLDTLLAEERKIVELRYFTKPKCSWVQIGLALSMDNTYCCTMRKKIIMTLAEYIFN